MIFKFKTISTLEQYDAQDQVNNRVLVDGLLLNPLDLEGNVGLAVADDVEDNNENHIERRNVIGGVDNAFQNVVNYISRVTGNAGRSTFDVRLPATHSYLGSDMEDVQGGFALLEEDSVVSDVPLIVLPGVILMPGQSLPIQSMHPTMGRILRNILARNRYFGVLHAE